MYNKNIHGSARNSCYMQIDPTTNDAIKALEGSNALSGNARFALLVYDINGGGSSSTSGTTIFSEQKYSQIVKVEGNYTYIMDAIPGSGTSADPVWRIQRVTDLSGDTITEWADGDTHFDNVAANYQSLSYSF